MSLECGYTKVAVVTSQGRFDLHNSLFRCKDCQSTRDATIEEYLCSGYWPGSISNNSYFFEEEMLKMWYHLRHKTPGTSERKFVETLEEISLDNDRVVIESKKCEYIITLQPLPSLGEYYQQNAFQPRSTRVRVLPIYNRKGNSSAPWGLQNVWFLSTWNACRWNKKIIQIFISKRVK